MRPCFAESGRDWATSEMVITIADKKNNAGAEPICTTKYRLFLCANKADKPELCEGLDLLYNERSYDGRIDDSSG